MAEPALGALYQAMLLRLAGGESWNERAYADLAPEGVTRPYIVYFWSGGGARNRRLHRQDAELVLTVKGVANTQAEAFAVAGRLVELLDDKGEQDDAADHLNGGDDWHILTTTQEGQVRLMELIDGQRVYHEGFQLRVVMEQRV